MKRALQTATALAQQPERDLHVSREPEYLLSDEAADFLRFKGPHRAKMFRKWATRNHVPVLHRGRTLLYERRVLDAFLRQKPWTVGRHAVQSAGPLHSREGDL